jgi:hypothetical protein
MSESFSCGLDVLYRGLGISKLQFFINKKEKKISVVFFFSYLLVIKTLDPCLDPDLLEMQDSDPYPDSFHESRSTTLEQSVSESVGLILYLLIIIYRGGITVIAIR